MLLGSLLWSPELQLCFFQASSEAPHSSPVLASVSLVLLLSSSFAHGAGEARVEKPDLFIRQQEENQMPSNVVHDNQHVSA